MSQRASEGLGRRVAKYRRMAGLSAQQLSDRMHGEMSRGVIANIESGRKQDVTVDQLIALAWALGIPPVAIALPVDEPHQPIAMSRGDNGSDAVRAAVATEWFNADPTTVSSQSRAGSGAIVVYELLKRLKEYRWNRAALELSLKRLSEGNASQDRVDEDERHLKAAEAALETLGADLTEFKWDE